MNKLIQLSLFCGLLATLAVSTAHAQQRSTKKTPSPVLTQAEADWLTLLRTDEKLARDTYLTLYQMYKQPIFANIAKSEQKHMDSVKTLLDRYKLPDPVAGMGVGQFPEGTIQGYDFRATYEALVSEGAQSLSDAYAVGVFIEEFDIEHLTDALLVVLKLDIKTVFQNLRDGSFSHLAAFKSKL